MKKKPKSKPKKQVARVYKRKNSKVKKALKFSTGRKSKLA